MKRMKEYLALRAAAMKRDEGQCCVCGKGPKYLNLAHIIPEEFEKFSLNLDNVLMLCPHHHQLNKFSLHQNPVWFTEWLRENRPITFTQVCMRLKEIEDGD